MGRHTHTLKTKKDHINHMKIFSMNFSNKRSFTSNNRDNNNTGTNSGLIQSMETVKVSSNKVETMTQEGPIKVGKNNTTVITLMSRWAGATKDIKEINLTSNLKSGMLINRGTLLAL
jgi:hypothetical protein